MKKQIGVIGVDSGQVLICDPCYIDSEWKKEDFQDIRRYRYIADGSVLQYGVDFPRFDVVIPKYNKTMNEILEAKEAVLIEEEIPTEHPFSYNACCKKTLSGDQDGQLKFDSGFSGVAVVSNTGYGDGLYPVYAQYEDGRVKKIIIEFF